MTLSLKNKDIRTIFGLGFLLLLSFNSALVNAVESPKSKEVPSTFTINVLKPPSPVPTLHGNILVYELQVVNNSDTTYHLGLIEIVDQAGKPITAYSGVKLQQNSFVYEGGERLNSKEIELKKGMGSFITIWISEAMLEKMPKELNHKLWFDEVLLEKGETKTRLLEYKFNVLHEKPVALGFPLKGANWVAGAGPSPYSYHRLSILPIKGKFYLAQRYAIDWMQICPDGKAVHGDFRKNEDWNGFGEEIYAVADGVVERIHDQVAENVPPQLPVPQVPIADVSGNFVMLKIHQNNKNYYVLNAHIQPGSIRVKEGDIVKKGQVIGLLGNTGNSSAPHLHLHVCDNGDPLMCEGVPFVFEEVKLVGNVEEIDLDYGIWTPVRPSQVDSSNHFMPIDNQVFNFTEMLSKQCSKE
jgi:hypothetical protein